MNNTTINIDSLKALAPKASNKVKHFCRTSAQLYGKLALREQFRLETALGAHSSFYMVELDEEELQDSIRNLARVCANTPARLNILCRSFDITPVYPGIDNASLVDVVDAVNTYVAELVGASDYRDWL